MAKAKNLTRGEIIAERKARFPRIAKALGSTATSSWGMYKDVAEALDLSPSFIAGVMAGKWRLSEDRETQLRDKTRKSNTRLPRMDVFRTQGASSAFPQGKEQGAKWQSRSDGLVASQKAGKKRRRRKIKRVKTLLPEAALSKLREMGSFPTVILANNVVSLLTPNGPVAFPNAAALRLVQGRIGSSSFLIPVPPDHEPSDPVFSVDKHGKVSVMIRFAKPKS